MESGNVVHGVAHGLVQAGLITGGVHLHPPRAPQVPRQLPPAPAGFIGRADAQDRLTDSLAAGVCALAGAGGTGKTWLAVHWAHRHAERYPDGQLFVDLRGFSPDSAPVDPLTAVRAFLDALGADPTHLTGGLDEHSARYRSLVAGKRMLIVLDNAADARQIGPLLPGGDTCAVLVTSRRTLTGLLTRHGATHLPLDPLTTEEAHALLVRRLGAARVAAEPRAAAELVELCGGFPLALGILAGRAHANPRTPLVALAEELRELGLGALADEDPTASLPAVLSWSYQALTEDQREVFRLVGSAPGPCLGLPAAASLLGVSPAQARVALRGLVQASLLTEDGGRWRMHDLIRRYALAQAEDRAEAALRRVSDFYLHSADAGSRLATTVDYEPFPLGPPVSGCVPARPGDLAEAHAWFQAEYPNLLAIEHLAAARGWDATVWQLAWVLQLLRTMHGHHGDNTAAWQSALAAAARLGDPLLLGWAHGALGAALLIDRQAAESVHHLRLVLGTAAQLGAAGVEAHMRCLLAWALDLLGDREGARQEAVRSLTMARELGSRQGQAHARYLLGRLHLRTGELTEAYRCLRTAREMFRAHSDHVHEAETLDALGETLLRAGRPGASRYYRQAVKLFRAKRFAAAEADSLERLGNALHAEGRLDEARRAREEALTRYQEQGREADVARISGLAALPPSP